MTTFHAYYRVSSERQVDNNSLDTQKHQLKHFHAMKYQELPVLEFSDPAVSASVPWFHRPDGERLWALVQPGDVIAVATFDRAFRSLADLCHTLDKLEERKVTLHCLDLPVDIGTIEGQAFFKVFAVFKELERKTISKRVKAIYQAKREQNLPVNKQRPLGYKTVGMGKTRRYIPWKEEREFGEYLTELRRTMSHEAIFYFINAGVRKGEITVPKQTIKKTGEVVDKCSYNYIQRLLDACAAGYVLPDGGFIPTRITA